MDAKGREKGRRSKSKDEEVTVIDNVSLKGEITKEQRKGKEKVRWKLNKVRVQIHH